MMLMKSRFVDYPIRVLHIVTNMSFGGLENLLMNYYRSIDRTKIQFDFLTHFDKHQDFEEEINSLGGKLFRLPPLNPFSYSYRKKLDSFFRQHKEYKIVHCHLDCMAGFPLKYAKRNNVSVRIAHSHNSNMIRNAKYFLKLFYKRLIPKYATSMFSCGKIAGDWMFAGNDYKILNNAINSSEFTYNEEKSKRMREKLCVSGNFIIGNIGQFRLQKNHLFLIRVFKEIVKLDNNVRLVLVGKGEQLEIARQLGNDLHINDKILFLGARSDIPDIMQAIDIFVLPSLYEGLPVTMIEAQASGLPAIISDKVPIECDVSGNVEQISLEKDYKYWAERILSYKNFVRKNNYKIIKESGFDIRTNAIWLQEFYINEYKSK